MEPAVQAGRKLAGVDAVAGRLPRRPILHPGVVSRNGWNRPGVGAAADAGDRRIGQAPFLLGQLPRGFRPDTARKSADRRGTDLRAGDRADQVEGAIDVGHPIAQRTSFLWRPSREYRCQRSPGSPLGAQQPHAEDVGLLADRCRWCPAARSRTTRPKRRGDSGGGHAVHAGAGLGDDAFPCPCAGQEIWPACSC